MLMYIWLYIYDLQTNTQRFFIQFFFVNYNNKLIYSKIFKYYFLFDYVPDCECVVVAEKQENNVG